jgi:hypothetical protein
MIISITMKMRTIAGDQLIDETRGAWGAVQKAIELSKCQEFLRFPILVSNLLLP